MKKISAILLVLIMVFSAVAAANETDKTEQVLSSVKERIPDTDSFETFEASTERNFANGKHIYTFYWSEGSGDIEALSLTATESGIITRYYADFKSDGDDKKPTMTKPSSDEALICAEKLVNELNPLLVGKLSVKKSNEYESLYSDGYDFAVIHKENETAVAGDEGYVRISADLAKIESFRMDYTEGLTYADNENLISEEEAKKSFSEKIGMKLSYKSKYADGKRTAYLSYTPADTESYIDAATGEVIKPVIYSENIYNGYITEDAAAAESAGSSSSKRFSEAEINEITAQASLISEAEAEKKISDTGLIKLPENVQTTVNLSKAYNSDTYYYNFYFRADDYWASGCVEAKSGRIISLYNSDITVAKGTKKLERSQNEKKALEIVKILCADKVEENGEYRPEEGDSASYFSYRRYVNGIPVDFDDIKITVNVYTGEFASFEISESDIDFPSTENIITESEAVSKMFENVSYEALYIPVLSEGDSYPVNTELVYALSGENTEIDAVSGKPVYDGGDDKIEEYTDIKGHWAETAINTLAKYGIGFAGGEFKPDELVTEKEFAALVIATIKYNRSICLNADNLDFYAKRAVSAQITENGEEPDGRTVTRETAAVYFVNALGYGEIAKLDGVFKSKFSDVTENEGAIAILSGMKILNGTQEGLFSLGESLTRAQAAVMIYNYFS